MKGLLEFFRVAQPRPTVVLSRPRVVGPGSRVLGPTKPTGIEVPARFVWDEKRWRQQRTVNGFEVTGRYRVFDRHRRAWREFDGRLVESQGIITAYIADPPVEIRQHRHGSCVQLIKLPWFFLHWQRSPASLDQALLYMERMLDESINGER